MLILAFESPKAKKSYTSELSYFQQFASDSRWVSLEAKLLLTS